MNSRAGNLTARNIEHAQSTGTGLRASSCDESKKYARSNQKNFKSMTHRQDWWSIPMWGSRWSPIGGPRPEYWGPEHRRRLAPRRRAFRFVADRLSLWRPPLHLDGCSNRLPFFMPFSCLRRSRMPRNNPIQTLPSFTFLLTFLIF